MTRALVTGGSGFVGANLARRLLDLGHDTHLLLRPNHRAWRTADLRQRAVVHVAELSDRQSVTDLLHSVRPEWIFHLATYGAYSSQQDLEEMLSTNVVGTCVLASAALAFGCGAFINTGSSSEYGLKDHAPSETEPLEPNSNYAVTKAAATHFCAYAGRESGANITTLRLYSVYGPWEEPTRFIPNLMTRAIRGELPPLASPATARDFVYVDDVVDAYIAAAERPSQARGTIYNIGTGVQTTLREIVELAREKFSIATVPQWGSMGDRSWDTDKWVSDPRRARDELGWAASVSTSEGLSRFAQWLQADEERLRFYSEPER